VDGGFGGAHTSLDLPNRGENAGSYAKNWGGRKGETDKEGGDACGRILHKKKVARKNVAGRGGSKAGRTFFPRRTVMSTPKSIDRAVGS